MPYEYKRVDITTLAGLKEAEKLKEDGEIKSFGEGGGWKIHASTLFSITFKRERKP